MTYTPTVPQANQTVSATQPLIQANFAFLDAAVGVDHNFDASNSALTHHVKVSLPNTAIAETAHVTPATGADGVLYTQASGPDTTATSGLRYYSTTGNQIFRLTDCFVGADGFQWIGAMLLQWGTATVNFVSNTITYKTPFPTAVYCIQFSPTTSGFGNTFYIANQTVTTFNLKTTSTSASGTVYWIAIGN